MRAYCLTCELAPQAGERVQALWYEVGMLGCEEESAGDRIRLKAYFSDSVSLHTAEFYLMDLNPSQPLAITEVKDEDWNAKWKQSMKPVLVAEGIWVSPAWLRPRLSTGQRWIKIEPKMAFGTGHHESTRLACRAMFSQKNLLTPSSVVLDIGTGSGILCFVADCMNISRAVGIDNNPVCALNLAENKRKNSPKARVSFAVGTADGLKKDARFDIVVMNMISSEGRPLLDRISRMVQQDGRFIWSGLLLEEKENIRKLALENNFITEIDFKENEWWCAVFRKGNVPFDSFCAIK